MEVVMKSAYRGYTICGLGGTTYLTLHLNGWPVLYIPLTYTVQECLEEFCEKASWNIKNICPNYDPGVVDVWEGQVFFELPYGEIPTDTIQRISLERTAW